MYENPHESADGPSEAGPYDYWTATISTLSAHGSYVVVVNRNDAAIAYINCESQEEAKWLKNRLTGTRLRTSTTSG